MGFADHQWEYFETDMPRPHVARMRINRPERSNSIHTPAHVEWSEICDVIAADDDVWLAIFTGSGDRAFCAGRDLKHTSEVRAAGGDVAAADAEALSGITRFVDRHDFPKPVIAAVNGAAMGGGFEVALACDLIVAADHAVFSLPEVKRGLYAGGGGVHRLPRAMPQKLAMEYLLTGRKMTAAEAMGHGLVNRVVPADQLDAAVDELVAEILDGAPLSVRATKQAAMAGLDMGLGDALRATYPAVVDLRNSDDSREGPLAFSEKRKPNWTGR